MDYLSCNFIESGRSVSFVHDPEDIITYEHFLEAVLGSLERSPDLLLDLGTQIPVLSVELYIIKIFTGKRMFGDIVPSCTLNSFAHLPPEVSGKPDKCSEDILGMENADRHPCGRSAELAFDLLPHYGSCSHIGHKYEVGKEFEVYRFLAHDVHILLVKSLAVICGIINIPYPSERFGDRFKSNKRGRGLLDASLLQEYRTEGGYPSVCDLICRTEEIIKFERNLGLSVRKSSFFLGRIYLVLDLELVDRIGIIGIELIAAGILLAAINIPEPVIESVDAGSGMIL